MKLAAGAKAPDFTVKDLNGAEVKLSAYRGKKVLLTFYRFADCPFCNLRVNLLMRKTEKLEKEGLVMLAFFYSHAENMKKFTKHHKPTFPVIPDPELTTYLQYGVEDGGMMAAIFTMLFHPFAAMIAMMKGYFPSTIDGSVTGLPADFLIDEEGVIKAAHYGSNFSDHLGIDTIEKFASARSLLRGGKAILAA